VLLILCQEQQGSCITCWHESWSRNTACYQFSLCCSPTHTRCSLTLLTRCNAHSTFAAHNTQEMEKLAQCLAPARQLYRPRLKSACTSRPTRFGFSTQPTAATLIAQESVVSRSPSLRPTPQQAALITQTSVFTQRFLSGLRAVPLSGQCRLGLALHHHHHLAQHRHLDPQSQGATLWETGQIAVSSSSSNITHFPPASMM
jgi:hypothetical protein